MASIGKDVSAADALKAHNKFQEALALHQQGQLKEARALYERALKWQPNHFDALHMLATIAYQTGQLERAEVLFIKALKLDPEASFALNNFGNLTSTNRSTTFAHCETQTFIDSYRSNQVYSNS